MTPRRRRKEGRTSEKERCDQFAERDARGGRSATQRHRYVEVWTLLSDCDSLGVGPSQWSRLAESRPQFLRGASLGRFKLRGCGRTMHDSETPHGRLMAAVSVVIRSLLRA